MARELWWASLNQQSPRYRDWYGILEDDRVPLLSPWSASARLGEETCDVYALDWQNLDEGQSERLLDFLAKKFVANKEEIVKDFDRDGFMPIRATDVTVFYDMRAFL